MVMSSKCVQICIFASTSFFLVYKDLFVVFVSENMQDRGFGGMQGLSCFRLK